MSSMSLVQLALHLGSCALQLNLYPLGATFSSILLSATSLQHIFVFVAVCGIILLYKQLARISANDETGVAGSKRRLSDEQDVGQFEVPLNELPPITVLEPGPRLDSVRALASLDSV